MRRRVVELAVLAAAVAVAAFLRLDGLGQPSLWLDEILHYEITSRAVDRPWFAWVIGFERENGPLYYAAQLATRFIASHEFAARASAALFGIATVVLIWFARSERHVGVAAIVLAVSPLHVYYSREARPYALLMLLAAALIVSLLRARSLALTVTLLAAAVYTAAASAPLLAGTAATAAIAALLDRDRRRWYWSAALAASGLLVLSPLLYRGAMSTAALTVAPVFDLQFFERLVRNFSVTAASAPLGGRTAATMLALALIGAVGLARRNRREAVVLIGMTLIPLAAALAALLWFDRWYAVRYVAPSLIGYVLLVAAGIETIASRFRAAAPAVAIAIAILIAREAWPASRVEPFQKLDWRAVASTIAAHARPDDIVITAESWSDASLRHYLEREPRRPQIALMPYVELAEMMRNGGRGMWVVSAGYEDSAMRRWMCGFPMIAASPLENLRVHYVSRTSDFLRERGGLAEVRAFSNALGARGFTLRMAEGEERFFGEGWALPEGAGAEAFRWVAATRAALHVPRIGARDRVLRMRVLPFEHPSLPPQTMRVTVNGSAAGGVTLRSGWNEQSVAIPARFWRDGWNSITLEFSRATAPSAIDPRAHDSRPLAASFDWIAIDDAGAPPSREREFALATVPRSATGALIDANTRWRATKTRYEPATLRRDLVEGLLGRLGFDAATVWPRLARGELRLEDLAESLAYGQDCVDGDTFLRYAFAVILERPPSEFEQRDLHARMGNGVPRTEIVRRILRAAHLKR